MCGHHEGRTGLEVGALVDGGGSIRKAFAVFSGRLEITVLAKISFSNVGANEKNIMIIKAAMSQAEQGCFLCGTWGRSPKPTVLGQLSGTLLNVAGAASELKCTSGIFILLRDHHEKSFQWSRFCEEKSAVALFFLEAAEEAHL